jgi:hypothetical protein
MHLYLCLKVDKHIGKLADKKLNYSICASSIRFSDKIIAGAVVSGPCRASISVVH